MKGGFSRSTQVERCTFLIHLLVIYLHLMCFIDYCVVVHLYSFIFFYTIFCFSPRRRSCSETASGGRRAEVNVGCLGSRDS